MNLCEKVTKNSEISQNISIEFLDLPIDRIIQIRQILEKFLHRKIDEKCHKFSLKIREFQIVIGRP